MVYIALKHKIYFMQKMQQACCENKPTIGETKL